MAESIIDRLRLLMGAEQTLLTPEDEQDFQKWAKINAPGANHPDERFDTRGYWLTNPQTLPMRTGLKYEPHGPDTFKQHGHPTFSLESKYSAGGKDGGFWPDEIFRPPMQRTGLPSLAEGNPNYLAKPVEYTLEQNPKLLQLLMLRADKNGAQ